MGSTDPNGGQARPPAGRGRPLRGYGWLAVFVGVFTVVAALVPTVGERTRSVPSASAVRPDPGNRSQPTSAAAPGPAAAETPLPTGAPIAPDAAGPSSDRPPLPRPSSEARTGPVATSPSRAAPGLTPAGAGGDQRRASPSAPPPGGPAAAVGSCPDRPLQVPGDPYSPPCRTFTGDNGGATSRGVSGERIAVSARTFEFPTDAEDGPLATFAFDRSQLESTIAGLFEYFSDRFQLYGRRFEPVFFEGQGDFVSEFGGAGQEGAEADAVKVAEEIKPFAELLGLTTPFSDALARRQVVNMGALFMSREWYQARSPYVWTSTPDCTFVLESASDYLLKRVIGRSAAHAGGDLAGTDRKLGVIAPDNPWFQECVDAGMEKLEAAGAPAPFRASYRLDFNQLSNQAASLVAKLRDAGVTTVVCGCDPALPIFLTSKAHEQGYQPEWILIGAPFSDTDVFGQSYQQDQWSRAFGLSFTGTPRPTRATHGYHAFKAARPNEEPIELVDYLYHQMYVLALGVHMAGPNLTPETFRDGLYAWAGGSGAAGTWRFDPGRHTPTQDAREIYWDREATSPHNGKPGTYIETEPGRRYRPGQWRREDPPVFRSGDRVPAP